jgi:hypothetical protein
LVAADGGFGGLSRCAVKAGGGDAAALVEGRCSELALKPVSFTRRRGSGIGASETSGTSALERKKMPLWTRSPVVEVSLAS